MDGDELDAYLAKYRAEVRRDALLEACGLVCPYCELGVKAEKAHFVGDDGAVMWKHDVSGTAWVCLASRIRILAAAQTDEEDEEI